ncbi:MAG: hypothetical protein A3H41_00685 [Omnitrophica WOR_2 bacterium RIFCSPLOWO2_02_FULL_45_28]|nr:MAG: hypothetical protein A3H41_00685 [Omnitrophica WOR_2 bacterium RIFCSPLOWO2_02_FULL_45_28]
MILRTGNKAFTLIEVMVATAVLALGMLFIHQGFLNSLDVFDYYANYLELAPLANEKIQQAQDELRRLGPQAKIETRGEFSKGNKPIDWDLSYNSLDEENGLYKIDLAFSWKSALRRARILRSAYALFDEKK